MTIKKNNIILIAFTTLTAVVSFFLGPQQAQAACDGEITPRVTGGNIPIATWYDDENRPYMYFDIQTSGCDGYNISPILVSSATLLGDPGLDINEDLDGVSISNFLYAYDGILNSMINDPLGLPDVFDIQPFSTNEYDITFKVSQSVQEPTVVGTDLLLNSQVLVPDDFTITYKAGSGNVCGSPSNPDCILSLFLFAWTDSLSEEQCEIVGGENVEWFSDQCIVSIDVVGGYAEIDEPENLNQLEAYCTAGVGEVGSFKKEIAKEFLCGGLVSPITQENPKSMPSDTIRFDCDGPSCGSQEWEIISVNEINFVHPSDSDSISVETLPSNYQQDYIPLAPLPFEGLSGGPTPTLGEYLASIFRMAIVVIVILAVIMIVFHGIALATVGAINKRSEHKDGVWNAIIGLLLALGSWLLLNTINPRLASQLSINIPKVNLEGDAESISTSPVSSGSGTITGFTLPTDMNLYCPLGGGSSAVPGIIDSFDSKVTYRWGGKGSDLPAGASYPMSPNESNNGQYMCNQNGQSVPCRNFCPDNSVCLDCSGFVNHVRKCAGLSIYSGTSSMTQSSDAIEVDMGTLSSNGQTLTIGGSLYTLQPGDILVWNGHVVVYYGDGKIAESKGDLSSIKNANQNIKKTNLAQSSYKNKITHLIKVNP